MTTYVFTLIVQENKPTGKAPGTLWLLKDIGLVLYAMGNEEYVHWASGNGNLSIADGTYFKATTDGVSPPNSPTIGDIWLKNDQSYSIYLGNWAPFGGG
jgi:hypothetical protein